MIGTFYVLLKNYIFHLRKEILFTNSLYFFSNTILVSGLGFIFWWLAARLYPTAHVGETVIIVSIGQFITTVSNLGLSYSIIKFLPITKNKSELINFALSYIEILTLILSILTISIGPKFSPSLLTFNHKPILTCTLFLGFVMTLALFQFIYPLLASLRAGKFLLIANTATAIGRILFEFLFSKYQNSYSLVFSYTIPMILVVFFIFGLILPREITNYYPKLILKIRDSNHIVGYSFSSYVGNVLHDSPYQLLPQIIANNIGTKSVAYFYIIWNFFTLLISLGSSISLSLFVEGSYKMTMLGNLFKRTIKSSISLTIILSLLLIIIAKPLLSIFGNDYMINGTNSLRIITLAALPAIIIYTKTAALRVESHLSKVIKTFAIISCASLSLSVTTLGKNLTSISLIWVLSQIAAALYIMSIKNDVISNLNQLIITHPMDSNNPNQGGGIRYLINILNTFTDRGWSAIVLGAKNKNRKVNNPKWKQMDLISIDTQIPFLRLLPYWARYLLALYLYLPFSHLPQRATIISHRMDCMLAFVLFKKTNAKVLISATPAHYLRLNHPHLYGLFGWIYKYAERVCLNGVDCIVPVDSTTKKYYTINYPKAKLSDCIPSPIDFSLFSPRDVTECRSILGWEIDKPIVLFVGRLARVKNIPLLLNSFIEVEKVWPNAQLNIVGDGEERNKLEKISSHVCNNVKFIGEISPDKMPIYFSASDLTVLCSMEEGSPTIIKESLACGTPVVTTNVGDAYQIISDDQILGEIVQPDTINLANGIINTLKRRRKSIAEIGRRRDVVRIYSIEYIGSKLEEICLNVNYAKELELGNRDLRR
jgi:glycosyltransferase involved in cell wall biosynthesis/O-antigen/teichoic acid export membrane protein